MSSSLLSPDLSAYRDMTRHLPSAGEFVIESTMVIERALQSTWKVHSVVGTPNRLERLRPLSQPHTVFLTLPQAELNELVGFPLHRGCAAHVEVPSIIGLPTPKLLKQAQRIVLAEGLSDPANIGSLLRNARAFGVDLVVLDPKGGSPFCRKAARASAGHLFGQPFCVHPPLDALETLRAVHGERLTTIGASVGPKARPLYEEHTGPPWLFCLGNEGSGLSSLILRKLDKEVTIPMSGNVDSLNVAAASAVLLYELAGRLS